MNTQELKTILISQISAIEDQSFLEAIKLILDSKPQDEHVLTLTPEIRTEIEASQREVKKGLVIENNELEQEIKEWLTEK